jgi:hypothetical protein
MKKAAAIAVNNCYGLNFTDIMHNPMARTKLAQSVNALLAKNRFLWFIPTPEYEDEANPIASDDPVSIPLL